MIARKTPKKYHYTLITIKVIVIIMFIMTTISGIERTYYRWKISGAMEEGDLSFLEIGYRDGILFINRKNFDENINLNHYFKIFENDIKKIPEAIIKNEYSNISKINDTTHKSILDDQLARKIGIYENKHIANKNEIEKSIQELFKNNWNKDNFGPLKIPEGKAFVLGDNRDNSEDSRYIGLIEVRNIKGKVIIY